MEEQRQLKAELEATKKQQQDQDALHEELAAAKQKALEANITLMSSPRKNERLNPFFTKGGKQKKDPTAPENSFGGGRVGKVSRGKTVPNPMQDMVSRTRV